MTAREDRRQHAESILRAAIDAADPAPLVERALRGAPELEGSGTIHIVAIGKAAPGMFEPAATMFGDRLGRTLIVAPHGTRADRPAMYGGHPLPDADSRRAGRAVAELLEAAGEEDHVLVLLSGGASAAAVLPSGDIAIEDYAACVNALSRAGADIVETNLVRRHLDLLKGGGMARLAAPARVLGLVLSDVVGDRVDVIASGPLTPDDSAGEDALIVLRRHDALDCCADSIRHALEAVARPDPAERDDLAERVRVRIIGGNDVAMNGAADRAAELGYTVRRAPAPVTGSAREAGFTLAREALHLQRTDVPPVCIVAGGETTVAVQGQGRGGRNQELVLAACLALDGAPGITVASIGTDGVDGATDAAGAIADEASLADAAAAGIDAGSALADNDSFHFFSASRGLVTTGPTGTNVNDVQIALIGEL